jgi:hypothetical protein
MSLKPSLIKSCYLDLVALTPDSAIARKNPDLQSGMLPSNLIRFEGQILNPMLFA